MAGQSVWHRDDLAQIGATLIAMAPSLEFAAGVGAMCNAVGAPVRLPERREVVAVVDGATLTPRQIEMRCDRVEGVLAAHWSKPDLARFYVSSPDGKSFFVSGPNAERIVQDQRNEFGLAIGDHSVQVEALTMS